MKESTALQPRMIVFAVFFSIWSFATMFITYHSCEPFPDFGYRPCFQSNLCQFISPFLPFLTLTIFDIVNNGLHYFLKEVQTMLPSLMNHSIVAA